MRQFLSLPLHIAALGAMLGVGSALAATQAGSDNVFGLWNRDDGLGGVRIAKCGAMLCGHVTWLKDKGGPGHIGQRVFYDMRPSGVNTWTGRAHNPADGKDYAGTMVLSGDKLVTSGCILGGLICKSLGLSRGR